MGAWQRLEGLSEADGAQMVFGVGQVVQWVFDVGRWEAGVGRGGAVGVGRVAEIWAGVADGWEIFVIGVGCANRHFILRWIRGKSPSGQTRARRVCWTECSRGGRKVQE